MKNCSEGNKKMAQTEVIITANDLTHQIYTSLNCPSASQEYALKSKMPQKQYTSILRPNLWTQT
jgi:hypothetical protein